MLDIGSGWGALACHAARHYGVNVIGVTLSEQQIAYARDKVQRLGLADKVTFELRDYALLEGRERFDKISSIGMFEAIGVSHFDTYFQTVHRLLKPGGLYLHHAITRPGKRAARQRGQEAAGIRGADALHLSRRRTRLSRPHDHQSRAARLRGP